MMSLFRTALMSTGGVESGILLEMAILSCRSRSESRMVEISMEQYCLIVVSETTPNRLMWVECLLTLSNEAIFSDTRLDPEQESRPALTTTLLSPCLSDMSVVRINPLLSGRSFTALSGRV